MAPLIDRPMMRRVVNVPQIGLVMVTANALLGTDAVASNSSLKVSTSEAPFTVALKSDGAVVSNGVLLVTSWSVKLATSLPKASASLLPVPVSGRV